MSYGPPGSPGMQNPDRRPLPEGWVERYNDQYKTWFYVNTRDGNAPSWTHPLGPPPPVITPPMGPPPGPPPPEARGWGQPSYAPYQGDGYGPSRSPGYGPPPPSRSPGYGPPPPSRSPGYGPPPSGYGGGYAPEYGRGPDPGYGRGPDPGYGYGRGPEPGYGGGYGQQGPGGERGWFGGGGAPPATQTVYVESAPAEPPKKSGMGVGAMVGIGAAGLLGGALLENAFEDHNEDEYREGFDNGADQQYDEDNYGGDGGDGW